MNKLKNAVPAAMLVLLATSPVLADEIGKPGRDLSGTYDTATLTPLERPEFLGETKHLYPWVANTLSWLVEFGFKWANESESDPDRGAPPAGGDGIEVAGAGGVGGYNTFYIDPGTSGFQIDGMYRTSIIVDPPDGRMPARTPESKARLAETIGVYSLPNTGTAWWLENDGPGPYDGPEDLALAERCLLSFAGSPPILPSLYNNFTRIVQTETHVMILLEMVHDARIVRLNSEHAPASYRSWLGDSIGWWEGDTLVVDTTNFREKPGLYGADENLHLVERFTRMDNGDLRYGFTVDDPTAWEGPWSGEYVWRSSDQQVYEYACHEGNYAMGNILRGARLLESEWEPPSAAAGDPGD
jgi:hypothetical protein